ncbi:hypothetical protein L596_012430 [Steinernema carpocapsae]|uniref:Uncharacterized protein n=1 Tax=Steinernema carpocapsae TaxID=34508 RepID=A0A4U5NXU6_STECR|nr:hypothetical protein L596_012430 [Steinernema carpocapsae]
MDWPDSSGLPLIGQTKWSHFKLTRRERPVGFAKGLTNNVKPSLTRVDGGFLTQFHLRPHFRLSSAAERSLLAMDLRGVRFFFVFAICAAAVASNPAASGKNRCIHVWVTSPVSDNEKKMTTIVDEEVLLKFYDYSNTPPVKLADVKDAPFFESARNYCLYFKPLENRTHANAMMANDVHSAIQEDRRLVFDYFTLYNYTDKVCKEKNQAGIGFVKKIDYGETGFLRTRYTKVQWICCYTCGKTIEEVERRMLIHLLHVNYMPKKANFRLRDPTTPVAKHLRKRATSPCRDIYGEVQEFAVPHYTTPLCPVYAHFDPVTPSYVFNHSFSTDPSNIQQIWDSCLLNTRRTKKDTCVWNYDHIDGPVELKCCCYDNLAECTRRLSNRKEYTRCFNDRVDIYPNGTMIPPNRGQNSHENAAAEACTLTMTISIDSYQNGIVVSGKGFQKTLTDETQGKCVQEMRAKGITRHCTVSRPKKKTEQIPEKCAFKDEDNSPVEELQYNCCCEGEDLCNLAHAREIIKGMQQYGMDLVNTVNSAKKTGNLTSDDVKKIILDHSMENCPHNPNEFLYSPKRCVRYYLAHDTSKSVFLLKDYHFEVKDYVEFGKFSNCSMLEINVPSRMEANKECLARNDSHASEKLKFLVDTPLYILECKCSDSKCELSPSDLSSIDTNSYCYENFPGEETKILNMTELKEKHEEPSHCITQVTASEKGVEKFFGSFTQTNLARVTSEMLGLADYDALLKQTCSTSTQKSGQETVCYCMSKESEPCNGVALMNKALNINYGQRRLDSHHYKVGLACVIGGKHEKCEEPGCWVHTERSNEGVEETKFGCIHPVDYSDEEVKRSEKNRYSRRLCLLTKLKNDCSIIDPPPESGHEQHVFCCCEGEACQSDAFAKKRFIRLKNVAHL